MKKSLPRPNATQEREPMTRAAEPESVVGSAPGVNVADADPGGEVRRPLVPARVLVSAVWATLNGWLSSGVGRGDWW